ncbi:MAG: GTPase domain-containing protein [Candidatus Sumerlaeaceae bacterium]|nr:GTPase domain-containing protein [Candidatus Sumerlaeaceae bacterium]
MNFRAREISCKLVYCGPSLGGKTTNIKALYNMLPPESRSDLRIIDTHDDRTLFFDFFSLSLASVNGMQTKFLIYAVPGQAYYQVTRKMVLQGVDGVIFVADSERRRLEDNIASLEDLKTLLSEHGHDYTTLPLVLQYNKRDLPDILSTDELNRALNELQRPWFESVATEGRGVQETFRAACSAVLTRLGAQLGAATRTGRP